MRKTIKVRDLIAKVNDMLAESTCTPAERSAMCTVLETVLHDTDTYTGYGYLTSEMVPAGELPGIVVDEEGAAVSFPDDTRRVYYTDGRL